MIAGARELANGQMEFDRGSANQPNTIIESDSVTRAARTERGLSFIELPRKI